MAGAAGEGLMANDTFETVAITYSQPETLVMLAMFEQYGIPAYALGFSHARAVWPLMLALGGIIIRIHPDALDAARALLAEVAERPAARRPRSFANWVPYVLLAILGTGLGVPPTTRTASTFILGDRRRPDDQPQG